MVEMVLQRILISEISDQQYIFLKEKDGDRSFPIVIGFNEAQAIDRFVKGERFPRPMTHDLLAGTITALGGKVTKVEVTNLKEGTFYAVIHLDGPEGRKVEVDARPSDAIALATAAKAPIFVAEQVIEGSAAA
ncbi:MAG TPA: bifunctional nuclease family protein [Planctomycetota bacterium]|nr:bifunctional nuclease family protein [Planctomycetota bacterium]